MLGFLIMAAVYAARGGLADLPVARSESLVHNIKVKGVHASFPLCTNSRK